MSEALQAQLTALGNEVRSTALPGDSRHTAVWCMGQLPPLYAKYHQTSESRYGEEITRLVRGVLKELAQGKSVCQQAQQLAASIIDRLRLLHEEFGLPGLGLKSPGLVPLRSQKSDRLPEKKNRAAQAGLEKAPAAGEDSPAQVEGLSARRPARARAVPSRARAPRAAAATARRPRASLPRKG
jgi:hypothetical protein